MEAGGYENEEYWQGDLATRWLKGEDVSGGQFAAWLEYWKYFRDTPNWKENFELSGNYSPQDIKSYEYVAGLTEDELKSELGKQLAQKSRSQPQYWKDREQNNPSQPVVGITWFEAKAYCAWLSEVTGKHHRLSSEVEWEAAARGLPSPARAERSGSVDEAGAGGEVHRYPWGDEWDKEKANSLEGRVMKPSPVGAYAAADAVGPFGAEDQAGNVYDWTSSLYLPYPYDPEKSEQEESDAERVVRGGSWNYFHRVVRCANRHRYIPDDFTDNLGFRLVSPGSDISEFLIAGF